MTPKQAAEALAKARDLTRRAERNRRAADKMPGTRSARDADARADRQSQDAETLFDRVAAYLEQA
jgi:hypothetical protein